MKGKIRRWLEDREIWWHSQNLNHKPGDDFKATGSKLVHGRVWFHLRNLLVLAWGWNLWCRFCGLEMRCSSEEGFTFRASFPPVSVHLSVSLGFSWFRKLIFKYDWYEIGFAIHHWALWVHLWDYEIESRPHDPFWSKYRRRFSWEPLDTFFGRYEASEEILKQERVVIPMPEANYEADAELQRTTQWRSRWPWWPFRSQTLGVELNMVDPVPFPGKGESAWDCGEDATLSSYAPAESFEEAISILVGDVLKRRRRYGGRNWKPEKLPQAS